MRLLLNEDVKGVEERCSGMKPSILALLDELRIIGQNGLRYAENCHDEQRYNRLLELVAEYYGETLALNSGDVREQLAEEVGHITPKIAAGVALFDEEGRILLMKRTDTGDWLVPGGFVEPNEGPEQAAIRETNEETNLDVRITELVGTHYQPATEHHVNETVALIYLCERLGGTLQGSEESSALQYWHIEDVPTWHRDFDEIAFEAREVWHQYRKTTSS
jgi:ADP-ribose pyrophosphatase YjhB (NUDIX family)